MDSPQPYRGSTIGVAAYHKQNHDDIWGGAGAFMEPYFPKIPTAISAYWNYKNPWSPEEAYFLSNIHRIREIRSTYDPNGLFQYRHYGFGEWKECFAGYHCSGHGSTFGIPDENGLCHCDCDTG